MRKRIKKGGKHPSYRLAFKLYCFHFVMGHPAVNSLVRSARVEDSASIFIPHTLLLVQSKVAGFLPEL